MYDPDYPCILTAIQRSSDATTSDLTLQRYPNGIPGVTLSEFAKLFAQCRCGKIVTCKLLRYHVCNPPVTIHWQALVNPIPDDSDIIIDLTEVSEDEQV